MEILQVKDVYKDFSGLQVLTGSNVYRSRQTRNMLSSARMGPGRRLFSILSAVNINLHPDPFCSKGTRSAGLSPYVLNHLEDVPFLPNHQYLPEPNRF